MKADERNEGVSLLCTPYGMKDPATRSPTTESASCAVVGVLHGLRLSSRAWRMGSVADASCVVRLLPQLASNSSGALSASHPAGSRASVSWSTVYGN